MSIRRRASRVICAMPSVAGVVLAPDVASAAGNGRRAPTSPVKAIKGKATDSPVKTTVAGAECESPGRLQSWGDPVFNDGFNDASRRCSSGCLDTVGKFSQKYGRFEVRAKLPTVKNNSRGVWPAFWLRPDDGQGNEGEIDVFEAYGTPAQGKTDVDPYGRSEATAHVYQPGRHGGLQAPEGRKKKNAWTSQSINLNDGKFHTWAAEWTPSRITFFIDGRKYHEVTKKTWGSATWNKFFTTDKFNIRLNVQVGSSYWGLPEPGKTADSTEFVVDYVRAWAYRG